jgi:broad specificity phosphatase PhoE
LQCHWSQKDGNGSISWKDAELTPKGHTHALAANRFWKELAPKEGIPFPEVMYTSPLWRCLQTVNLTFTDITHFNNSRGVFVSEVFPSEFRFKAIAGKSAKL